MNHDPILSVKPLGFLWETSDPFLFCAHHDDAYPKGNAAMGPAASLAGRDLGQDFAGKDGWRMYHGESVPGFPQHPHRGFETITLVRRGLIDHSDSLGATARFGHGDAQWLTAGRGIVHCEMFPLVDEKAGNPLELFQIWLNLPAANKLAPPHFSMFWNRSIPRHVELDGEGRATEVALIAGSLGDQRALAPPPHSWAARADSDVAIWTLKFAPHARWTLPAAQPGSSRTLYFFSGETMQIAGRTFEPAAIGVRPEQPLALANGAQESELLLLQGKPIQEPVAQHGPFVMNSREEIEQAIRDYQNGTLTAPW